MLKWLGLVLLGLAAATARAAGPVAPDDLVQARLLTEQSSVAPGQTLWTAIHFAIKPGWHIYWRNPGDAGVPTAISWQLPDGFSAGEIVWPAPEHFVLGGLGNYGYANSVDLLVPLTALNGLVAGGTAPLRAEASWLACAEICIPGTAKLDAALPVTEKPAVADPAAAALFAAARRQAPVPAPFEPRFGIADGEVRLFIPAAALAGLERPQAAFYPYDGNVIDQGAEPKQRRSADGIELVVPRAAGGGPAPATLDGVVAIRGANGERLYAVSANPAPGAGSQSGGAVTGWEALLLAFLGGLVLNLMPCVFPVLSLKVLSLAATVDTTGRRRHGLAYGAGVLLSFAALGGALLALRGGGAAIGWGFQLQSPLVVGMLAYLLFAMGLSLSGVAEFGGALAGVGGRFAGRGGAAGAFATGVLATVVATPCTAPFMGTALGFALVAPAALALAVFVALGAGMAAPLVLAALIPATGRMLPRPGPWMVLFKQLLAFPLYGTVAWLIWVLMQEAGPRGSLAALFGLVLVAFAVWIYGRTRLAAPVARRVGAGLAAAGIAAAVLLAATVAPAGAKPAPERGGGLAYEKFASGRLAVLAAEGKPVFVNLTAAWCLTCLVNEQATLDSAAVRDAFAARGIVALKGDWTRQDPDITAFLEKFGRSGVPLYVLYDRAGTPAVLPQILTQAELLRALEKI
jgi:thiol:disulfide interchange protein DsbD